MPGRRRWPIAVALVLVAGLACSPTVVGTNVSRRVAERGPSALLVGALFTIASPPGLVMAAVKGRPLRQPACRLEHGLAMLAASPIVVPAGVVLAPFHPHGARALWFDGVVDAFQEDYCSRPVTSLLP